MDEFELRHAGAEDFLAISILLSTSFDGPSEAVLVRDLRTQGALALELVAVLGDRVIGHISFPRLEEPDGWFALAPVTVRWDRRGRGIGSRLVAEGLDMLRRARAPAVVVVGDPDFYRRFGFSLEAARNLKSHYPASNFMLYPLAQGVAGCAERVVYPRAFSYP